MKCPFCHSFGNNVIDTRLNRESNFIRRRRKCTSCERRFTTYERIEEVIPAIVKKDGRRESYMRAKVISGLKRACEKLPISIDELENFLDKLEQRLNEYGKKEVPSSFIGEEVMRFLQQLHPVAYIRFASVYKSFKHIGEFMQFMTDLQQNKTSNSPMHDEF